MMELIEANWPLLVLALLVGLAIAWWLFVGTRRTTVTRDEDTGEAGDTGAKRNQALIDAPAAAASEIAQDSAHGEEMAEVSPGPTSAAANSNATAHAGEQADAEAGAPGSAREALQEMRDAPPPPTEPAPSDDGDDLTRIKGLGPKLKATLAELGVTRFDQIAGWSEADIDRVDAQLGRFQGRIRRDNWVEQARLLGSGDEAGYEGKFGKL